jgi:hypothetical protein
MEFLNLTLGADSHGIYHMCHDKFWNHLVKFKKRSLVPLQLAVTLAPSSRSKLQLIDLLLEIEVPRPILETLPSTRLGSNVAGKG